MLHERIIDGKSAEMRIVGDDGEITYEKEPIDVDSQEEGWFAFKTPLKWVNIISISAYHLLALYAIFTVNPLKHIVLTLWGLFLGGVAGFGVTGGAHRYWTHRTYKAKLPLRIILMVCYLVAGENRMFDWVRDHRVHHKYTESDADPHDSRRGFFFSHVGWLMMKKHPEVIRRGQQIDMSDVLEDPVVQFEEKYFLILKMFWCFFLPIFIPLYFWNTDLYATIMSQAVFRYIVILNSTWSVNSFAHIWGYRSYDKAIKPVENKFVAAVSMGEGWHNYHHVFPWDYKAAELGNYSLNLTTFYIDLFAKIGWAYDLKSASPSLVRKIAEKKGDGTHAVWGDASKDEICEEKDQ